MRFKKRYKQIKKQNTMVTRGLSHKWFWALMPNFCAMIPNFEKLFSCTKVWLKVRKFGGGRKTVYEIYPKACLGKFKTKEQDRFLLAQASGKIIRK